jgi:hypothetical protein
MDDQGGMGLNDTKGAQSLQYGERYGNSPESIVRSSVDRNWQLKAANAEIMDMKDQMRKAELDLQKTVQEKDKLQRNKNQ